MIFDLVILESGPVNWWGLLASVENQCFVIFETAKPMFNQQ